MIRHLAPEVLDGLARHGLPVVRLFGEQIGFGKVTCVVRSLVLHPVHVVPAAPLEDDDVAIVHGQHLVLSMRVHEVDLDLSCAYRARAPHYQRCDYAEPNAALLPSHVQKSARTLGSQDAQKKESPKSSLSNFPFDPLQHNYPKRCETDLPVAHTPWC